MLERKKGDAARGRVGARRSGSVSGAAGCGRLGRAAAARASTRNAEEQR